MKTMFSLIWYYHDGALNLCTLTIIDDNLHIFPRAFLKLYNLLIGPTLPISGRVTSWHPFCVRVQLLSHVRLFVIPWTVASQAPLSVESSRQEYWSMLPFPTPGDLPDPRIEPASLTSALAGGFFTTSVTWKLEQWKLSPDCTEYNQTWKPSKDSVGVALRF